MDLATIGGVIRERSETFLAGERANWPGWLAVALGLGIAVYFALPVEPPLWLGATLVLPLAGAMVLARRDGLILIVLAAPLAAAIGFGAAQFRTALVAAPQLQDPIRFAHVTGRVAEIEPLPHGVRATLDQVAIAELPPAATPLRIRVSIMKGVEQVAIGARLDLLANLQPPAAPAVPGAFDFRRQSYFARLGATGIVMGMPHVLPGTDAESLRSRAWFWIDRLRATIGTRIAVLEPSAAGAMVRALTVGDQTALTADDTNAMRISGLAHLLSISGLHIGMAAGLFFFGLRSLLALIPRLALRHPIKKWSAAAAILAAGFYALLAGATVPTERSFVMIAIVFLAVMVDRAPFSFRMLAWAAIAVLLLQPESITGASFQMSFFAVLGLIAAFEVLRTRLNAWRGRRSDPVDAFGRAMNILRGILFWFGTLMLTSGIATVMTAPFAMYHFDRLSTYGVVANMVAVPVTGFWVMPMGMAALLLMPFGWDAPFWHAAARGCDVILWIARTVSDWPHAVLTTQAMPLAGLVTVSLGLVVLCLMQSRWRLLGLAPVLAGLALVWITPTPDLLVSGDLKQAAVKDDAGLYHVIAPRAAKLATQTWLRRNGQVEPARFPEPGDTASDALSCDAAGCIFQRGGSMVALVKTGDALAEDCRNADLVVALVPIRGDCPHPRAMIDRFDLWRGGAYAVWLGRAGQIRVESVAASLGDRPWVLDRMRQGIRERTLVGDPETPADGEAEDTALAADQTD
ncbi:MAG TPA: ComEC/Rec2 family competence protein [Candidatus Binatia bacterium]|nr:ComEC/Rec2 family competence protein [Candidatus Binatia bacterium]